MTAKFVWYDLNTKDIEKAKEFYTKLFGWNIISWKPDGAPADMPEYQMLCIGEQPFGGMNALPQEVPAPAHWMGHVTVDDVDAAMERAKKLGAQFPMGAMDIPSVGRMAAMMDTENCVVSLFKPEGEVPEVPAMSTPGMVGWNELLVTDTAKAQTFYSEVVGWKWRKGPMTEMEYFLFGTGEEGGDNGGMMKRPDGMPVSSWFLYFTTADIDKSVAQIKELGGAVFQGPFDVPTVGKLAVCMSTDGSMFGLAEWAMS
ncbi:MAG: VOC family protein [Polyangiaceae bacterium]